MLLRERLSALGTKNAMLWGNFISNVVGVVVVNIITSRSIIALSPEIRVLADRVDNVFLPTSFLLITALTLIYERPIRNYVDKLRKGAAVSNQMAEKARRRLLNQPFALIVLDLAVWLIAAVVYPLAFHLWGVGPTHLGRISMQTTMVGLITTITAFFLLEHILQKRLAPTFFPEGRLTGVPGTLRIRIRTRLLALLCAVNFIPFMAFLGILRTTYRSDADPLQVLNLLRSAIRFNSLLFILLGLLLVILVSANLTHALEEIIEVLQSIRNGRLDQKVRVTTNDEIGYTGDVINEMTEGLKEREALRHSLELAREVQLNLLPRQPPGKCSYDIAGKSLYCDQTGGDYFDYIEVEGTEADHLGLVIGDVSGHGISAALLMATARAFLRLRSLQPGPISRVITDVNRQLARDINDSGQFMTLFYLRLKPLCRSLSWVRAGHDPAIFYDPRLDVFEELRGAGIALGINGNWQYEEYERSDLQSGQILVLGTDGVWEACNPKGEMFGKQRLCELLRQHASYPAARILEAVLEALQRFQAGQSAEDDITLVVVKIADDGSRPICL
jgi:sigma-B regulation protein RsbU (phosphoserine phosphatase)